MTSDRTLNERIALAMGWTECGINEGTIPMWRDPDSDAGLLRVPAYDTDPAASDSLIDWMEREGYCIDINTVTGTVTVYHPEKGGGVAMARYTSGDSASRRLAIAMAAAEALGA